jgi:O-6-methylguanine DNA methyltransferase
VGTKLGICKLGQEVKFTHVLGNDVARLHYAFGLNATQVVWLPPSFLSLILRCEAATNNRVTLSMNFDEEVWELMKKIPEGRVTTYGQIAKKLNTKAYRAVGNACRKNPYAPRVPCHRVVRSDGTVGGFGGRTSGRSVEEKSRLLRRENVEVRNGKIINFGKVLFRF